MSNFTTGDVFHNRYELLEYLGGGELSEVWRSEDQLAGIEVALKIYIRVGDAGIRQFIKDFTLTEALVHPYILKPHHVDVCDRRPYLILKFCRNGSVSNRIDDTSELYQPFTEKDMATFMYQIGGALSYLHKNQILHRDVKPDNILVSDQGDFLLTDFGISKRVKSTLTKATSSTQVISFSRPYAPPEILTGIDDPKKDVFSLGVTMYELLTEDLPFDGNGGTTLLIGGEIPNLPDKYSKGLNDIIKKCMAKDLADRLSAAELERYGEAFLKTGEWPQIEGQPNKEKTKGKETGIERKVVFGNMYTKVKLIVNETYQGLVAIDVKKKRIALAAIAFIFITFFAVFVFTRKKYIDKATSTVTASSESKIAETHAQPKNPRQEYDSLMKLARLSLDKEDFKTTMQLTEAAWLKVHNNEAKKLYEFARKKEQNRGSENVDNLQDQKYIVRGDQELRNGAIERAWNYYQTACGKKKTSALCDAKFEACRRAALQRCNELLKQGTEVSVANKSKAIALFKEARQLADLTNTAVPEFAHVYETIRKKGDGVFENEEFQDAKKWYLVAQVLSNTSEIKRRIQQCDDKL